MVSMDQYLRIRLAHQQGMGINQLARAFHHSKRKIRQILDEAEPRPYPKRQPCPSVLDPFKPVVVVHGPRIVCARKQARLLALAEGSFVGTSGVVSARCRPSSLALAADLFSGCPGPVRPYA